MDNEKDGFIKNKIQEDKLISKKAEDIFNKLSKGELNMEEKIIKDEESKEKVVSEIQNKKQSNWKKKVLATAASIVILFGAANVYASTQGYENIFFMIKYLITGEQGTIEGKDNILSDRDITISYEPINIAKGLSITIKKMQVKDNQAKLFVVTAENDVLDSETVPLKFKVFNSENVMLCKQTSARDEQNSGRVEDELILENYKNEDTILSLEIYKANVEKIATLKINLEEKTVEVVGEAEALNKISEIELKDFLSYVAKLSTPLGTGRNKDDYRIATAIQFGAEKDKIKGTTIHNGTVLASAYKMEEVNEIMETVFNEKVEYLKEVNLFIKKMYKDQDYYVYNEATDENFKAECINISNISYCNGLYSVTYTYYHRGSEPDEDLNMDNYDIYEQNIVISLNENSKYSKFKVISKEEPIIIKKAEINKEVEDKNQNNTNLNNTSTGNTNSTTSNTGNTNNTNTSNEKIDNYATSMSWAEYWAPGIKFQYPTEFTLTEEGGYFRGSRQGEVSTKISGVAVGINPDTKERIDSNLIIYVYEPLITKEDVLSYYKYGENGVEQANLLTNRGLKWYCESGEGKELPYVQTWTHIETSNSEYSTVYKIEFHTDRRDNFKITNIVNWLLASTKLTSY